MKKIIVIVLLIIVILLFFLFVLVKETVSYNCGINLEGARSAGSDCSFHNKFTLKDLLFGNSSTLYSK
ncbi:hypothetical protein COX93_02085 [Candidatus Nomurabacteria bacterium CG_4_10_14_0_2_um_filter_30_12]|uniref:Uncharacterized protein n=2 Tax=Candidatus Nomuraibacteriota TaxID=1752729 RepID=A0A2J0MFK9_9BACT|nr:MAG: hypothetical protein COU48_02810 [Candidatus Nomurabacteria bacterium CG10_big_fil_rev_8_21_14_0_10_03_31_7]PIZ87128.1 MAG: hypothetical protein COX93_02085 [Candidatus Nomurabacteria bacterium CG_4_10_14_0_2_um_filter_30_12]